MASHAAFLLAIACLACGGSRSEHSSLTLGLSEGSDVQLRTGETLYVFLIATGAGDSAVTFTVDGGPPYVTIDGSALRIAPPRPEPAATFDLEVTAHAGATSDSKLLHVIVERGQNTPPQVNLISVMDERYRDLTELDAATPGAFIADQCFGSVNVSAYVYDEERGRTWVEVEVAPADQLFTGTPTHRSRALDEYAYPVQQPGPEARGVVWLSGLQMWQRYHVAIRAIDEYGDVSDWVKPTHEFFCAPFALRLRSHASGDVVVSAAGAEAYMPTASGTRARVPVNPGVSSTLDVVVLGSPPAPIELSARGLPPWAFLSGTALQVDMPAGVSSGTMFPFELTVTSGGHSLLQHFELMSW